VRAYVCLIILSIQLHRDIHNLVFKPVGMHVQFAYLHTSLVKIENQLKYAFFSQTNPIHAETSDTKNPNVKTSQHRTNILGG